VERAALLMALMMLQKLMKYLGYASPAEAVLLALVAK
jgi:hypothetical protein